MQAATHKQTAATSGQRVRAERKDAYARRRPEDSALYQCVAECWPEFRERMEGHGGLPKFVRDEFEAYLGCGRLEAGCLELACRCCGHSQLVGFSCKRRGFCPACLGRRMSDSAVHLVSEVLPEVPVRHWVCTFPWGVRAVLGYDQELCQAAVSAFARELSRSLQRRAKRLLGLGSVEQALTGSVAVLQRTDSAVRLNVHVHLLALDGVYIEGERGELGFHALGAPCSAEVADIARRTARRVHRAFKKKGRPSPWDDEHACVESGEADPLSVEQPGLFACYQAAAAGVAVSGERAGQPLLRLVAGGHAQPERSSDSAASSEPVAEALGVNLYAKQQVDGCDRQQLERLCRYVMRPPLSQERLQWRPDGRLELTLKNVRKDGTSALVLEPEDLLVRLCACVPPPWFTSAFGASARLRAPTVYLRGLRPACWTPSTPVQPDQVFWRVVESFTLPRARGPLALRTVTLCAGGCSGRPARAGVWVGRSQRVRISARIRAEARQVEVGLAVEARVPGRRG